MMNCDVAQQLLQLYLDNLLEPAEAREVEEHVAQCVNCRSEFVQLERTVLALESMPRTTAPASVYERTMAQVSVVDAAPILGRFSYSQTNILLVAMALLGLMVLQSASLDLSSAMTSLDVDGPSGVVSGAMLLAMTSEVSFVAGIGLLLAAGSIGLLEVITRHQVPASR